MSGCIELLRRWRAFDLVEEGTGLHDDSRPAEDVAVAKATVTFRGVGADSGATLVVGAIADRRVTVTVRPARVLDAGRPLAEVVEVVSSPGGAATATTPAARIGELGSLEVFGVLLAATTDDELLDDGLGDALAVLAEGLPGRRAPAG